MNYDLPPAHIAGPENKFPRFVTICIGLITMYIGYRFLVEGQFFLAGLVALVFAADIGYELFGFKYCQSCEDKRIPRSKEYCYECWLRAKQSPDNPSNQAILNPED